MNANNIIYVLLLLLIPLFGCEGTPTESAGPLLPGVTLPNADPILGDSSMTQQEWDALTQIFEITTAGFLFFDDEPTTIPEVRLETQVTTVPLLVYTSVRQDFNATWVTDGQSGGVW